jgi:hypothetical protein
MSALLDFDEIERDIADLGISKGGGTTKMASCFSCKFWLSTYEGLGHCRRYPAIVRVVDGGPVTDWPLTKAEGWCGEYMKLFRKEIKYGK